MITLAKGYLKKAYVLCSIYITLRHE